APGSETPRRRAACRRHTFRCRRRTEPSARCAAARRIRTAHCCAPRAPVARSPHPPTDRSPTVGQSGPTRRTPPCRAGSPSPPIEHVEDHRPHRAVRVRCHRDPPPCIEQLDHGRAARHLIPLNGPRAYHLGQAHYRASDRVLSTETGRPPPQGARGESSPRAVYLRGLAACSPAGDPLTPLRCCV